MQNVLVRHPAELDDTDRAAVRALGGVHALRFTGDRLVGYAALVERRFPHTLRTGYVEACAVPHGRR